MTDSKNKRGRPTKYKPEYDELAFNYSLLGATDVEMAGFFDIDQSTLHDWKKKYPEFSKAIKSGKEDADANVVKSLYKRAQGYSITEEKEERQKNKVLKVTRAEKHIPADTTAAIFWLKNRQKAAWRDKQEIEHSGSIDVAERLMRARDNVSKS